MNKTEETKVWVNESDIILLIDLKRHADSFSQKSSKFKKIWSIYSITDKVLCIVQFGTILYSILFPEQNIGLILSMYTLSFSFLVSHMPKNMYTLEKIIPIYEEYIIPDINQHIRTHTIPQPQNINQIVNECNKIENDHLKRGMGEGFILSNTLRSVNCKKIVSCIIVYVVFFILIPVFYGTNLFKNS